LIFVLFWLIDLIISFNDAYLNIQAAFYYNDYDAWLPTCGGYTTAAAQVSIYNFTTAPFEFTGQLYYYCPASPSIWYLVNYLFDQTLDFNGLTVDIGSNLIITGYQPETGYESGRYLWEGNLLTATTTYFGVPRTPVSATFQAGGSSTLGSSVIVHLNYNNGFIAMNVDMVHLKSCAATIGTGTINLPGLGDGSTLFNITATYYPCVGANAVQWVINGLQITPLRIGTC
jgi:hypothetical protein